MERCYLLISSSRICLSLSCGVQYWMKSDRVWLERRAYGQAYKQSTTEVCRCCLEIAIEVKIPSRRLPTTNRFGRQYVRSIHVLCRYLNRRLLCVYHAPSSHNAVCLHDQNPDHRQEHELYPMLSRAGQSRAIVRAWKISRRTSS